MPTRGEMAGAGLLDNLAERFTLTPGQKQMREAEDIKKRELQAPMGKQQRLAAQHYVAITLRRDNPNDKPEQIAAKASAILDGATQQDWDTIETMMKMNLLEGKNKAAEGKGGPKKVKFIEEWNKGLDADRKGNPNVYKDIATGKAEANLQSVRNVAKIVADNNPEMDSEAAGVISKLDALSGDPTKAIATANMMKRHLAKTHGGWDRAGSAIPATVRVLDAYTGPIDTPDKSWMEQGVVDKLLPDKFVAPGKVQPRVPTGSGLIETK